MTTQNDTNEPSLASDGSQPVAWAVRRTDGWIASVSMFERTAECEAGRRGDGWSAVPLYRKSQPTLTDAEREAVDRVRIAFRDMDHNDMTRQQLEDYEAICHLLERVPLYAQPQALLAAEERDAVRWAGNMIPLMAHKGAAVAYCHAETLRKLDERLG
jgi:hypothetical protein